MNVIIILFSVNIENIFVMFVVFCCDKIAYRKMCLMGEKFDI